MMDHKKHEKFQVLDVFEYSIDESQSLVVVEEELELPLEYDSTTLEPTHEKSFEFFKEVHNNTSMDPSHDENFALSNHLDELVLSHTSYTSIFCRIHPNELCVKGFFFMVPCEECEITISF